MSDKTLEQKWIDSTLAAPQFSCGRLDMASWDASDGVQEKYVYVEGHEERYQIKGQWCDEIAFAAAGYQAAMKRLSALDALEDLPQTVDLNFMEFIEEKALLEEFKSWLSGPLPKEVKHSPLPL